MAEFKDNLRFLRKKVGLTQAELAKILHLAPSTITMYECGKRFPERDIEEAIADFFNVSLNELRGVEAIASTPIAIDYVSMTAKEILEALPKLDERDLRMIAELCGYFLETKK